MSEQFRSYWAVLPGEVAHDRELTTGPPIARRAEAKSGQMTWEDLSGRPDQGFPFAPWQPNMRQRKNLGNTLIFSQISGILKNVH